VLELNSVSRRFGGLTAVDDVSVSFEPGTIIGLIGPNGAGKTTLVNVVTGVTPASSGTVMFNGEDVTRRKPHEIARRGVARTFQVVQPFRDLDVLDNVAASVLFARGELSISRARNRARDVLTSVHLDDFAGQAASTLTLAMRKRLELAKVIAMDPKVVFLDEVNAGLNSSEIDTALSLIRALADDNNLTIILIEHLMKVVVGVCSRVVVLQEGRLIADDTPQNVMRDKKVIGAYLGKSFAVDGDDGKSKKK
jgi:branched-chain amino acid transport system ATP-binding protein